MIRTPISILLTLTLPFVLTPPLFSADDNQTQLKQAGVFYPQPLLDAAQSNIEKYVWAQRIRDGMVTAAAPFLAMSDNDLWSLMVGPTITRSWMVWSNGHCPACQESVPMYNWQIDAIHNPWKLACPHCHEKFPKNDFARFRQTGLDPHGIFDPKRADRTLLFNTDHPDANDPLHHFGVDDGEGYVDGENRWRFVGTYIIYGQWKQAVLGGIRNLAAANLLTGDPRYAHKAGILLDRVADLYPTFDFKEQAFLYEKKLGSAGYVSVWHDACEETRQLALAYDQVFNAIRQDGELVTFLAAQAKQHKLDNPKASFADIQRNIEDRILRDALNNRAKIFSNYPRTEIAVAVIQTVLGWPHNKAEVVSHIDAFVKKTSAVDGVTGEKGLANYAAFVLQSFAKFLGRFDRVSPTFLPELLERCPQIHDTFRFHIDTLCLDGYYPLSGDTGWFAKRFDQYQGVLFAQPGKTGPTPDPGVALAPSMFTFLHRLAELTGDDDFTKILYRANGNTIENLPYDLFRPNPEKVQKQIADLIETQGTAITLPSINKTQWHLAILRSGTCDNRRAVWLDYDSGGGHGHLDGMNLGLFAKGLDLMPDFGYPPVQFGGWASEKSAWYKTTAAHNTVVVDGKNIPDAAGTTALWAIGKDVQVIRATAPTMLTKAKIKQFERTIASINLSDSDAYVLDLFRAVGGKDHAKFMHSHFGTVTTQGLSLKPADPYGHKSQMRNFQSAPAPSSGWQVDWTIEDRYGLLAEPRDIHLRYIDLTADATASLAECWINAGGYATNNATWIPRIMTRRQSNEAPLASTFVAVIEPYEKRSNIKSIRRLPLTTPDGALYPDNNVAVELQLTDCRKDLIIAPDVENPRATSPAFKPNSTLHQKEAELQTDAEFCWVRRDAENRLQALMLCRGRQLKLGNFLLELHETADTLEMLIQEGQAVIRTGDGAQVKVVSRTGRPLEVNQK